MPKGKEQLFIKEGFVKTRFNTIGNIPFKHITELLNSIIEHKKIYEIQKNMGIDTAEAQKQTGFYHWINNS